MSFFKDQHIFLFGCSHHNTPLEVREKLSLEKSHFEIACDQLKEKSFIEEFLILNTCNRVEIYGTAKKNHIKPTEIRQELESVLSGIYAVDPQIVREHFFIQTGLDAVQHIFEVTSGLNSQMLGETEILGQVKQSYALAHKKKHLGKVLHKVFQRSFQAAKWIRHNTEVGRGQISIGNVTVDLAIRIFGNLKKSKILLLGSGEVGEKTAKALKSRKAGNIYVSNRTESKASELASTIGADVVSFETWQEFLVNIDIFIGSTAAPEAILTVDVVAAVMKKRPAKPLFLIDLALPRDIDPGCGELPNVFLYNLDDLSQIANENMQARLEEAEKCRDYLKEKAKHLLQK